jgi:hypothetical protein
MSRRCKRTPRPRAAPPRQRWRHGKALHRRARSREPPREPDYREPCSTPRPRGPVSSPSLSRARRRRIDDGGLGRRYPGEQARANLLANQTFANPTPHGAREVSGPPVRLRALANGRVREAVLGARSRPGRYVRPPSRREAGLGRLAHARAGRANRVVLRENCTSGSVRGAFG